MISGIARFIKDFGDTPTAIKLLKLKYGEEIGKVSKTGNRAFKKTKSDGREVITVLNRDYITRGTLIKKEASAKRVNFERTLYNYEGDPLIKTDIIKERYYCRKPIYFYDEVKYNGKSSNIPVSKRKGIYNAETNTRQEVNILL